MCTFTMMKCAAINVIYVYYVDRFGILKKKKKKADDPETGNSTGLDELTRPSAGLVTRP